MAEILAELNTMLTQTLPVNIFMAMAAAEISPQRNHALIWNSGMEDVLILNASKQWQGLPSKSLALGILSGNDMNVHYEQDIEPGDSLYFLSDGITEIADNQQGQAMFGLERLKTLLLSNKQQNGCMDKVLDMVTEYAHFQREFDDMTLLEIKIA